MSERGSNTGWSQLTAGLIVAAIGLILLLGEADVLHIREIFRLWPLIVIFIGASRIRGSNREEREGGFVVLFIGLWLLINSLRIFGLHWHDSWPLVIVAVGLGHLLGARDARRRTRGVFLVLIGGLFQAAIADILGLPFDDIWPLALVLLGGWIIVQAFLGHDAARGRGEEVNDERS